ncbi:MAG: GyrI-like domain-containing protein [Lacinutrix sp.]|uniref:GyrI-like domain-containing protein n=1 Tax=Lacinutrix sp. TaxID=1937692 RepID=UPI0030A87CD4
MTQSPKILVLEYKKLVGQSINMSLVEDKTFELFSSFMPRQKNIKNALSTDLLEVLIYNNNYLKNFSPENTFVKWAAIEVKDHNSIPAEMKTLNLETGLYAVFNYKGLAKDFGVFMSYIYHNWLPKSKYQLDNRPHFNILGDKYKHNQADSEETVWIPIQLK